MALTPDGLAVQTHEQQHVAIYEGHWSEMVSQISSFTDKCLSREKANCYNSLVPIIRGTYWTQALLNNKLFDCGTYGNVFGACDDVQTLSAEVYGKYFPYLLAGLSQCDQLK